MSAVLHQASCVAIAGRALLIEGPPGSGKSSLALALIDRGAALVGDDGVSLDVQNGRLIASPPPRIVGLLEVRNLGLISFPAIGEVPVALVVRLDLTAERFIEHAESAMLCGMELPLVRLSPEATTLAIKAEVALKTYGLS